MPAMSQGTMSDLRRLKCKAGSSVDTQLKALELIKSKGVHNSILLKANRMQKKTQTRKRDTSARRHKFEWMQEASGMAAERTSLERELQEMASDMPHHALLDDEPTPKDVAAAEQAALESEDRVWQGCHECAVLVKSVRARAQTGGHAGSADTMLRKRAEGLMTELQQALRSGMERLEVEASTLEADVARLLMGQRSRSAGGAPARRVAAAPAAAAEPGVETGSADNKSTRPGGENTGGAEETAGGAAAHSAAPPQLTPGGMVGAVGYLRSHESQLDAQLQSLDNRALAELATIQADFEQSCASLLPSSAVGEHTAESATGGWDEKSHAVFLKVAREFGRRGAREGPRERKRYLSRLQLELPQWQAAEIADHDRWCDAQPTVLLSRVEENATSQPTTPYIVGFASHVLILVVVVVWLSDVVVVVVVVVVSGTAGTTPSDSCALNATPAIGPGALHDESTLSKPRPV